MYGGTIRGAVASGVRVMGGSFNPPTLAHLKVMEAALDAVDAYMGIFVPTNHA